MKERFRSVVLYILLFLACLTAVAWIHSHFAGYQRTWSDSTREVCGRFASTRGRMVWQQCDLKPLGTPELLRTYRLAMPTNFVVGSNPEGTHTTISCAGIAVPFAMPSADLWIGSNFRLTSETNGPNLTRWTAHWQEFVLAYWLLLLLLILFPASAGFRMMVARIKGRPANTPARVEALKG